MFVTENKVIDYPSKTILEDMLTRTGSATDESYSPWVGCAEEMNIQFTPYYKDITVTVQDIVSVSRDFSPVKCRPNDDGVDRDVSAVEVTDYYMNLEDISRDFAYNYIIQAIIGFKKNNNGIASKRKEVEVLDKIYDEEDGEYVDLSDIQEKSKDFSADEILEAKNKLPYLLKILHDGSLQYGGSLLSFIIGAEKFFAKNNRSTLRPRFLVSEGVYRMNRDGTLGAKFTESDNSGRVFPPIFKWVCGEDRNDRYYRAYMDLLKVLTILDIDIKKEDARNYPGSFIKKAVCTYLASNEEYIENFGYADKKILAAISPDRLFEVARQFREDSDEEDYVEPTSLQDMVDDIATNTEGLFEQNEGSWGCDNRKVTRFLKAYFKYTGKATEVNTRKYKVCKGFLASQNDVYMCIDASDLLNSNVDRYAAISMSGKLVRVKKFDFELEVLDMDKAIDFYTRGDAPGAWSTASIQYR